MSANDNVTVRIVGDASGVRPAVQQTQGALGGLEPMVAELNVQMAALTAQMREGFAGGASAARGLTASLHETRAATDAEGNALTRMVMKVHEGAESVRTFQMRAKAFAEVYVGLFAVESVAHWAEAMGAAAEKTEQLSAKLGMSVPQVQALSGAARMSGTNIDVLSKALAMMDNKALQSGGSASSVTKAFHAMGISANDGASNMQRLLAVADKFHGMADGPTKLALSMQLFGRAGRETIPFLNQGSAAIEQLMQKTKDLGAVNEAAVAQGARLASSVNESKVAWEGLKQTLTEAFAPLLTRITDGFIGLVEAMHQSYESGGFVKILFEGIAEIAGGLGEIIRAVALTFSELFSGTGSGAFSWSALIKDAVDAVIIVFKLLMLAIVGLKDAMMAAFYLILGGARELAVGFQTAVGNMKMHAEELGNFMQIVGKVCDDALHLHWSSIAGDWDAGMAHLHAVVQQRANEILATTAHLRQQAQADFAAAAGEGSAFGDFFKKLTTPGAPKHDDFKFKFGGGAGEAPDISAPGAKGPKGKKDTASIMDVWKQQLADMLVDEKNWGADENQLSLQFWESKLALTKKGSKEEVAVRREIAHQKLALFKEELADELANIKQHEALQLDAAKTDIALARMTLQEKIRAIDEEEKRGQISAAKAIALRNQVNRQLYALDAQEEQAEYTLHLKALQDELKLEHLKPEARKEINRQIELLEKQHLDRMLLLNKQYDAKVKADSDRLRDQQIADVRRVTDSYTQSIAKLLTLQQGFMTTAQQLWQSLQQSIAGILDKILQKFALNEAMKLGLIKSGSQASIASEAALAGAGGVASMAAAPFPMDLTAPAFGASMSAAAMAFSGMNAAEGGWWDVKPGLAMLHSNEMVLPAWAAAPLRDMVKGGGAANFNAPGAANERGHGGDISVHFHSVIPPKPHEMRRFFEDHHQPIGAAVRKFVRQGGNTTANRV